MVTESREAGFRWTDTTSASSSSRSLLRTIEWTGDNLWADLLAMQRAGTASPPECRPPDVENLHKSLGLHQIRWSVRIIQARVKLRP